MQTKRISQIFTLIFSSLLFFGSAAMAGDYKADDIVGFWLTEEKTAVIQIKKDEKDGTYYGELVWLQRLHTGEVKELKDDKNPDKKLQSRDLLGLKNTWGFKFDGDDEWTDGEIYDPKSGKTYSAKMELEDGGKQLNLRGYVGVPLFGRTSEWSREEGKIPAYIQQK